MIFDSHCHLNDLQLYNDLDSVIKNALQNNVKKMLVIGYDKPSSFLAAKLAREYDFIYAAVGFHPVDVEGINEEDLKEVMSLIDKIKVVAVGEIGLDYHWVKDADKKEKQKEFFIKQIEYANRLDVPIVIHNRESTEDCLNIIKEYTPKQKGVMHCFSSSVEIAKEFIKLGFYISFGGSLTFTNAKSVKEVAREIDLSHVLVETDCPYLTPHPFRGKRNEPAYITLVVKQLAEIKKVTIEEVEDITYQNTCKLFHV